MCQQSSSKRLVIALSILAYYADAAMTLLGVGSGSGSKIRALPGSFLPPNASCSFNSTDVDGVGLTVLTGSGMVVDLDRYQVVTSGGVLTHSNADASTFRRGKSSLQFEMLRPAQTDAGLTSAGNSLHAHLWSLRYTELFSDPAGGEDTNSRLNESVVDLYKMSSSPENTQSYQLRLHGSMNVTDVLLPARLLPDVAELNRSLALGAGIEAAAAPEVGQSISVTSIVSLLSRVAMHQHNVTTFQHDVLTANVTHLADLLTLLNTSATTLSEQLHTLDTTLVATNTSIVTLLDTELGEMKHSWGAQLQSVDSSLTALLSDVNSTVEELAGRIQAQADALPALLTGATDAAGAVLLGVVEEQGERLAASIDRTHAQCGENITAVGEVAATAAVALNTSVHLALTSLAGDTHTRTSALHTDLATVNATLVAQVTLLNTTWVHLLAEAEAGHAAAAAVFRSDMEEVERAVGLVNETLAAVESRVDEQLDALWVNVTGGWREGVEAVRLNVSALVDIANATLSAQWAAAVGALEDQLAGVNNTARGDVDALGVAVNASIADVRAAMALMRDDAATGTAAVQSNIDRLAATTTQAAAAQEAAWQAALATAQDAAAQALAGARARITDEIATVGVAVAEAEAGVKIKLGEMQSALTERDAAAVVQLQGVREWVDGQVGEVRTAQAHGLAAVRSEVEAAVAAVAAAAAANVSHLSELMYGELATVYEGIQATKKDADTAVTAALASLADAQRAAALQAAAVNATVEAALAGGQQRQERWAAEVQEQVARINHTTAAALAQAAATHQLTDAHRATELARLAAAVERADGRWEGFVAQGWPEMRERLAAHGKAVELLEGERFGLIGPQLIGQLANTTNDKVAAVRGEVALLQLSLAAMREDVLKQALAASQALVAKQEDRLLALEGEVRLLVAELRKK